LRFLRSVLRVTRDFERAHCSVVKIAARADHGLSAGLSPGCRSLIARMGQLAAEMWRVAADAWYQRDRSAMDALIVQDADLDELCQRDRRAGLGGDDCAGDDRADAGGTVL
jgi:phosphate uptake regulator